MDGISSQRPQSVNNIPGSSNEPQGASDAFFRNDSSSQNSQNDPMDFSQFASPHTSSSQPMQPRTHSVHVSSQQSDFPQEPLPQEFPIPEQFESRIHDELSDDYFDPAMASVQNFVDPHFGNQQGIQHIPQDDHGSGLQSNFTPPQIISEPPVVPSVAEPIFYSAPIANPNGASFSPHVQTAHVSNEPATPIPATISQTAQFLNEQTKTEISEPVKSEHSEGEKVSYQDAKIQELDISKIAPNPFQPRKLFKPEALQELSDSIREHGVVQPIVVTETPTGYEIVVGERRFRASQLAGLTHIPAIVKKTLHDQTKLEVALIENIQRQELNAIEEAQAYDRLIKTFNMTQEQVAKKVGKSRPAITNTLRLLNLPAEIQRGVIEGRITEGHARAILGLPDIEKQLLMYQAILEQGLNVRQVEGKVREISVKRRLDAAAPDPKLMAIESELRGKLGAQVKIQRQGRGGKITIEFFSDEDLEEIMNRMAENKENENNNYFTV
ncbi:MAG: ParB/RepB/Spo0J family partition protein [bacterium]|nr:ParB/RepB/Spo0J family partition protein [bacterium]